MKVPLLLLFASASSTFGQFVLLDDFESYPVGELTSQSSNWSASGASDATVGIDSGNRFLVQGGALNSHTVFHNGATLLANGATGTFFFRVLMPAGGSHHGIAVSPLENTTTWANGQAIIRFGGGGSALGETIFGYNGNETPGYETLTNLTSASIWYNVWLVIDNSGSADRRYDVYLQSDDDVDFQTQTQVGSDLEYREHSSTSQTSLKSLFFRTANDGSALHVDDLYLDSTGENLNFPPLDRFQPLAADDSVEVGIGGAVSFDPLSNDAGPIESTSVTILTQPSLGTVSVDAVTGSLVYRHTGSVAGSDLIRYQVSNPGATASSEAEITVAISANLRLENTSVQVPLQPPVSAAGTLIIEDALPGLTFSSAVAMASVPGSPKALLVASINGRIWYIPDTTVANPSRHEVLNVSSLSNFTQNRSILSLEPYPDFATTGHLIVNYQGDATRLPMSGGSFDTNLITGLDKNGLPNTTINCDLRISRFTLSAAHLADAVSNGMNAVENEAALATEFPFLNLAEQHRIHTINDCKFGPDGYLYVSFGDEGDQGSPFRNGQELTKDQFSSIIRIDVDPASTNPLPTAHYAIAVGSLTGGRHGFFTDPQTQLPNFRVPADNPFLHASQGGTSGWDGTVNGVSLLGQLDEVRSEIWAFGLRNPFKIHLDLEDGTGATEVWVGDVGFNDVEEFTILKKGENGGWPYYEGNIVTPGLNYSPPQPSGTTPHKLPVHSYAHGTGNGSSATGGIYYRDTELENLTNSYLCGDYSSGRIWKITRTGTVTELTNLRLGGGDIVDFNLDQETKDVFVLEHSNNGRVMRITEQDDEIVGDYPRTLSETGLFADLTDLAPNPGVVPYSPNLTFWSDGADKRRWLMIPDLTDSMGYSQDGNWSFPEGMVMVKHFDYDLDQQNPGTNIKRLETRLLVRNEEGSYGVSYRWNEEGTEANLVANEGEDFPLDLVNASGGTETFTWHIPSRSECLTCHTQAAGHGLSLNTRQLNQIVTLHGQTGNQLELFATAGFLSGFGGDPASLPRHLRPDEVAENLEERVRSYLAVNCAYCHQPGGGPPESWDGRPHLAIEATEILYGVPDSEATPDLTDHLVRPGDKENSAIWNKINARTAINGNFNGYSQMPPLASDRFDEEGIALIQEWIENYANVAPTHVGATAVGVPEGTEIGASTGLANALDSDLRGGLSDQSQLSYAITDGNANGYFAIDAATGEITVTGWLDFEEDPSHLLQVTACDNFAPNPKSVTTSVAITVQDRVNEDGNGNGLPDAWEELFSLSGASAGGDRDGDGVSEFFEFLTGGDPTDATSPQTSSVIEAQTDTLNGVTFAWRYLNGLQVGRDYLIEGSGLLTGWSALTEGVDYQVLTDSADGMGYRRLTIQILAGGEAYFLRLKSP